MSNIDQKRLVQKSKSETRTMKEREKVYLTVCYIKDNAPSKKFTGHCGIHAALYIYYGETYRKKIQKSLNGYKYPIL